MTFRSQQLPQPVDTNSMLSGKRMGDSLPQMSRREEFNPKQRAVGLWLRRDCGAIPLVCVHKGRISSSDSPQSDRRSLPLSLQIPGHQSVFINEPRLSDFKQVLLREGIQAEFVGGVLVCNNMVAVRRVSVLPTGSASVLSISSLQR